MMDKINDSFANSNNPVIVEMLGIISNATAGEAGSISLSASDSSLALDVDTSHAGRHHIRELERVSMQGMLTHHQFVQADASVHMINWVSELVSCILSSF